MEWNENLLSPLRLHKTPCPLKCIPVLCVWFCSFDFIWTYFLRTFISSLLQKELYLRYFGGSCSGCSISNTTWPCMSRVDLTTVQVLLNDWMLQHWHDQLKPYKLFYAHTFPVSKPDMPAWLLPQVSTALSYQWCDLSIFVQMLLKFPYNKYNSKAFFLQLEVAMSCFI